MTEPVDWLELRVHGVSGTPPESMLASAHVCQVAGDDRSRSFRPTDAQGHEVRGDDGQVVEAFHWGRWTSGSWLQALWILLIPFGIVNAAQFMLPAPSSAPSRIWHLICGGLLRLLAVVLTLLFTLGLCVIVIDLVGWQWLARMDLPGDDRAVVAPAVLVTVAAVYGLSVLGRSREGRRGSGTAQEAEGLPDLADAAFFDGDPDSPALRHLHRAAAFFLISWVGFAAVAGAQPLPADLPLWVPVTGLALTSVVVLVLGDPERTTTVRDPDLGGVTASLRRWWHGVGPGGELIDGISPSQRLARNLHGLGLAAALVAVLAIALAPVSATGDLSGADRSLPGIEDIAGLGGVGGSVVLLLLSLAVLGLALSTRSSTRALPAPFGRLAAGMAPWLAAAIGFYLGIGATAGAALAVQGALNRLPDQAAVSVPQVLQRVSFSWGASAPVMVVLAVLAAGHLRLRRARFRAAAADAYTFGPVRTPQMHPVWLGRIGRAMQKARLKNHLELVFWTFGVLGAVLALAATVDYLAERWTDGAGGGVLAVVEWFTGTSSASGAPIVGDDIVIGLGQFLLLGMAGGAALLARGAIRAEGPRRALNVVWDVIAFWPRSVHPFVPPPYSQEVVPALVRRICWHLGEPDPDPRPDDVRNPRPVGQVVVAAHSQGSLISLAALLRLPPEIRHQVRWVTFGSQLRQQFPRAFPHYVRPDDLRTLAQRHRWISLYRDTDPIAGPVTSWAHGCDDEGRPVSVRLGGSGARELDQIDPQSGRRICGREWRLLDPPASDRRFQTSPVAAVRGHSDYWLDPDWDLALATAREDPSVPDQERHR